MLSASSDATVWVDKATSHLLIGPDWTMNMDICDLINSSQWQAKDVVKSVKKRLQHKNPRVQFLALTLLETMIKNCGDLVHFQVVEREILHEMVKIVRKKTDMQVRDKILVLLDSWQEAFGGPQGKYPQYYFAFAELKRTGVHFPQRSGDSAPIFTPPITHPAPGHPSAEHGMSSNSSMRLDEAMASEMGNLSLSELDSIRGVMELLDDMLQAVKSDDREAVKDEVIADLISQCRSNQKKIIHLVGSTRDEELLAQALEINDNLQYLIAKHDAIASGSPLPFKLSDSIPRSDAPSTPEAKTVQVGDEDEDDDGFAQLARRNSRIKPDLSQSSSAGSCDQETLPNLSDMTTATSTSKTEASSSTSTNVLALPDQSTPVSISVKNKEQDIIDLLSITLSTNPSPQTPKTTSIGDGALVPVTSQSQEYPQNPQPFAPQQTQAYPYNPQQFVPQQAQEHPHSPQPFPVNQGYMTYNNYVAPWAQQTLPQPVWRPQSQYQQVSSSYPPPPWATSSSSHASNTPSTAYQQVMPPANMASSYTPSMNGSSPMKKYYSFCSGANTAIASKPLQHQNSFGSRGNDVQVVAGVTQQNVNPRAPGSATVNKPFIPSYRLFEDLIDMRSTDGGSKAKSTASSLSSSSSQSMINGRK